jgi:hypothetical protein
LIKSVPGKTMNLKLIKRCPPGMSKEDYFWLRVHKTKTCWIWTRSKSGDGYGNVYWEGRNTGAHRVAYKLIQGSFPPKGLEIDHLCRNRICVNPKHLEAVQPRINKLRGVSIVAIHAKRKHCSKGHLYTLENLQKGFSHGRPWRRCRICRKLEYQKGKLNGVSRPS